MHLDFDAEKHAYLLDGKPIPSVSEIIAPLGDALVETTDLENAIEVAAERGTLMHKYIEMRLNGATPDTIEIPSEYEEYAFGVELFLASHKILPLAAEQPIASSEMWVAGTPDLVCEFDDVLSILDYKFVSTVNKTRVKAQLNGYRRILIDNGVFAEKLFCVHFYQGGYRLYPTATDEYEFSVCKAIWDIKRKKHGRGRID